MPTPQTTTSGGSLRGRFTSSLSCRSYNLLSSVRWASPPTLISKCSSLFSSFYLTSQVRQFTAGNVHIFADELFLYNVLFFFIKVQGHRFVTYFHAGKIKVLGHIFCLSKISCNRGHISVKYFKF